MPGSMLRPLLRAERGHRRALSFPTPTALAGPAYAPLSLRLASTVPPAAESFQTPTSSAASAPVELSAAELRLKAIKLYKELYRLGRDYPDPAYEFNRRLRRAFEKNATEKDPVKLQKQLELAEHIKKEVLALISLKKFRHLRRSYHPNEGPR